MPVRAATADEVQLARQRVEALRIVRAVARMQYLDSIETVGYERREPLARSNGPRVRQYGQSARAVNETDRIRQRQPLFRDERRLAISQPALERFAKINGESGRDHRTRHVRPTHSSAGGLLQHRVEGDRNSQRIEPLDDPGRASNAHLAQRNEAMLELGKLAQMKTEDMSFDGAFDGAELDATDHPNTESRARSRGVSEARDSVVIREREGDQTSRASGDDHVGRRARPVGRGRVRMQVNEFVLRSAPNERRITHEE